jgi:hypothetical protein
MVTFTRIGAAIAGSQVVLWSAFVLVHLWLGTLNLTGPGLPMGDVTYTYKFWTDQALFSDFWVGIDSVWVYPIVAIVPMLASMALGPELYGNTWLSIIFIFNAVAFAMLTGWGFSRERIAVAWWWVAFLFLLGPISLARIDSITVPLAIIGVLLLAKRPGAAAVILAIATWIKVWPAALLAAIVVATRDRLTVIWSAFAVSAGVIIIALAYGAGLNVFSFFTQQTGRGLQVEAPVATVWLWLAKAGLADAHVVYSQEILTYQIEGQGVDVASQLMTPIMAVAALVVLALGVLAVRRGASSAQVLPPLALALVTALLAFNKVGSPQFVSWLAVPIILGLVTAAAGRGVQFHIPAVLVLGIGALTQAFYPVLYANLLGLDTVLVIIITVRNLLYLVLLAWAVSAIWNSTPDDEVVQERDEVDADDSLWPFGSASRGKL